MAKFDSGRFKGTRGTNDDGLRKINGFTTKINADRQGKHIVGHKNYQAGRSVLHMSVAEAQRLVEEHAGSGSWREPNKEAVDFRRDIGTYVSKNGTVRLRTTRSIIHYSKTGCHIVPAAPIERSRHDR